MMRPQQSRWRSKASGFSEVEERGSLESRRYEAQQQQVDMVTDQEPVLQIWKRSGLGKALMCSEGVESVESR